MTTWPNRIQFDLQKELEARPGEDWQTAKRTLAERHGLKLELVQWSHQERKTADHHSMGFAAMPQILGRLPENG